MYYFEAYKMRNFGVDNLVVPIKIENDIPSIHKLYSILQKHSYGTKVRVCNKYILKYSI